ncbi:Imm26 family immunity protein [Microbacterium sp. SD291]|uniref:Imm26 family immunity protein n=1 Tax=Microbacterium sp. SD291 TaxID=2782007 RepID=UPI0035AC215D
MGSGLVEWNRRLTVNLEFLQRSRHHPVDGDIFEMQISGGPRLLGRVAAADIRDSNRAPMPASNLIYVFRPGVEIDDMVRIRPEDLLLAPIFTNRMGWTRGYFRHLENRPLGPDGTLSQLCFWDAFLKAYVDGNRRRVTAKSEPCGSWALVSYLWIDDHVSDALGIPRSD